MSCQFPGCHKPSYQGSMYCSIYHRDHAPSRVSGSGSTTCKFPGCSKAPFPGGAYCSKTHRDNASATSGTPGVICQFPGCSKPPFPGGNYCSKYHRDNMPHHAGSGNGACAYSGCSKPVFPGSEYCSKTHRDLASGGNSHGPTLTQIPRNDAKYSNVENQFTSKWLHSSSGTPTVRWIFRISMSSHLVSQYRNYQSQVENKGRFQSRGMSAGNECRRFHGTARACRLGDNGNTSLCTSTSCKLCSIIKTGFQIKRAGTGTPWSITGGGRLGDGIYTSATSSKSDQPYSKNLVQSPYKALLLNKVIVGNTKKLTMDKPNLTQPPPGYDSVVGEPGSASRPSTLNYDELVVYSDNAIIPAYLIIYDQP